MTCIVWKRAGNLLWAGSSCRLIRGRGGIRMATCWRTRFAMRCWRRRGGRWAGGRIEGGGGRDRIRGIGTERVAMQRKNKKTGGDNPPLQRIRVRYNQLDDSG